MRTRPDHVKGLRQVADTYAYNTEDQAHNKAIDKIVAGRMAKGDHVHVQSVEAGTVCLLPEETRCKFDGTDPGSDPVKDRVEVS